MSLTYSPNGNAAPARCRDGAPNLDRSGRRIGFNNSGTTSKEQDDKPLVARGGRFFSRVILTAWSPAALAAMDVRWRSTGERVCREVSR